MRFPALPASPISLCGRHCLTVRAGSSRQHGFTLVEAIISVGLVGALAVTATFFWVDSFALVGSVNADSAAMADGRALLERLAREIRETKYDKVNGIYCVSTMAAAQIVFNKTTDTTVTACGGANPVNNDVAVTIQRPANSTNLNLAYAGAVAVPVGTRALTSYASAFAIRYLDGSFAPTNSAGAVRFIELTVTLAPASVQATQSRTVVALRNN
jgi:type II secretory pathway pseudopilin PulG